MPSPEQIAAVVEMVDEICARNGIMDAFYVGGFPRSIAMGFGLKDVKDLDVASGTNDKAVLLAGLVAEEGKADYYKIRHRSGTVRIEVNGVEMDFQSPGAHEEVLPFMHMWGIETDPISQNIFDRDFTINALAMPTNSNEIMDITRRGLADIEDQKIASILPADFAVPRNPLMITRAIKFAYKYDYRVDGALWAAMQKNVDKLRNSLSPERLAIEAYVLSRYDCGDMLEDLGMDYMRKPQIIEMGQDIAEAQ